MDEYQDIKELLRPRRTIGASPHLRQRISNATAQQRAGISTSRLWRGTAAACVALMLGATLVFGI